MLGARGPDSFKGSDTRAPSILFQRVPMSTKRKMRRARTRRIAHPQDRTTNSQPSMIPPHIGARPAAPRRRSDLMKFLAMTAAITRINPEEFLDG